MDADAEAVRRTLLARPRAGAAEIGALLGLPEYRGDVATATLTRLALAGPSQQHGGRLRPVPPELGPQILLSRRQAELATQNERLESAAAARIIAEYAELRPRSGIPDVELTGWSVVRQDGIRNHPPTLDALERLVATGTASVRTAEPAAYAAEERSAPPESPRGSTT